MGEFVKSHDTRTPVGNSKAELERILRRYRCTGFGTSEDFELGRMKVFFRVPEHLEEGAAMLPVTLVVDIDSVHRRIARKSREQAERVAWRHLVFWVDAACSAAAAGLRPLSETFLADLMVQGEGGPVRMIERMEQEDWRRALPSGMPE